MSAPQPQTDMTADLDSLWAIAKDVWHTSFMGLDVGDALIALGVIILSLVVRGLFTRLLFALIKRRTEQTKTLLDDRILEAVTDPLRLIPIIIGAYVAVHILGLNQPGALINGIAVVQSLMIVTLFWALHKAVEPVAHIIRPLQRVLTPVLIDWMAKALKILFLIVGAAAVLQVWNIPVAPIVAGLGLFGVAVGLGAQDLFKNLIAGLLVLTEKRFLPGEWILVDGVVEGTVEQINFRSTLIRRFDKSPVYVPNSFLADNAVTNFSRMTHRRIRWIIGVEYKTTTAQLKIIRDRVLSFVLEHEEFAKPPEVPTFMRVDQFNASSIDFMLYCFTTTTNWGEWLRIKEELAFAIKRIVEDEAGTSFAFPSTTVYLDDGAERFMPPKAEPGLSAKARQAVAMSEAMRARGEDDSGEGAER
ncbi:mechanosensitive ion channel family protein [Woodsholea maritima]|uniref:mechanosensitive ion channel family protein n=1 Tax=Woodsholea maritima TaxID=240237 RepID=UPI00036E8EAB|nr:mechanosensitive ion channel family protein [Woodsholea maritima]